MTGALSTGEDALPAGEKGPAGEKVPGGDPPDNDPPDDAVEEDLPDEHDPYWDELTAAALSTLRGLRAAHHRRRAVESAYNAYVTFLVLFVYGGGLIAYAVRSGGRSGGTTPDALSAALPAGLTGVALLVLLTAATTGAWRGPVTLDGATVSWLLPLPVRWAVVTRPRWRLSLGLSGAAGAATGAVFGLVLAALRVADPAPALAAGSAAGLVLGVAAAGIGGLVESSARLTAAVTRWAWLARAVVVALVAEALLAAAGRPVGALQTAERWSGPWGWAVQPLLAAAGRPASGWWAGLAAAALTALALAVAAGRRVPAITGAALRTRAATWQEVSGGVSTFDFRLARTSVDAARGRRRRARPRLRLPVPASPELAVLWRDATHLLREPGRLVGAVIWLLVGLGLGELAAATVDRTGLGALALTVPAVLAVYRAAAVLVEPARLESDDRHRSVQLPFAAGSLAMRHAVLPIGLLAVVGIAGVAGVVLGGRPVLPSVLLLAAVPALVGGALVGAYRGRVPVGLLVGVDSPAGNTGPVQVVFWYLRGLLAAVVPVVPAVIVPLLRGSGDGVALVGELVLAIVLLSWARHRATSLASP